MSSVSTEPASSSQLIDVISECLPLIGRSEFAELILEVARLTGAGQVTAFAYEATKADCLLSRNFVSDDKGRTLAAAYVEGWFRDDPLFMQALSLRRDCCIVQRLEDFQPQLSPDYLAKFFGAPGFRTKIAVLVSQGQLRMIVNIYFEGSGRSTRPLDLIETSLFRLFGRTLATHFLRLKPPEFPLPLSVLSNRERQVCLGMLAGKKAEIIAEEIGVGQSSVVTYRQRAYQKLGISSRGQLFSICRGSSPLLRGTLAYADTDYEPR